MSQWVPKRCAWFRHRSACSARLAACGEGANALQHAEGCAYGLRQKARLYEGGLSLAALVLALETAVLAHALIRIGHCT